jgi:hypothetical protein
MRVSAGSTPADPRSIILRGRYGGTPGAFPAPPEVPAEADAETAETAEDVDVVGQTDAGPIVLLGACSLLRAGITARLLRRTARVANELSASRAAAATAIPVFFDTVDS